METKLTGIPETMLIPLWARAVETKMPRPIVRDDRASEILERIDYDFSKFAKAKFSQLGVSIRTMLLDNAVRAFLNRQPSACIINLGAGLDTRRERLGCANVVWYDLDLPEAIALRRRFFSETPPCRFIESSVFDESWIERVNVTGKAVLLIAEGLLVYFAEEELKPLFATLAARFPGAEMLVEVQGPAIVGRARQHDSLKTIEQRPEFKWGAKDARVITRWHPRIEFVEEWCFFDYHQDRAGWFGYFARLPFIRSWIAPRIVRLRFQASQ
ncbi:MAG TPA: class I SAM-dependent methyltransferase [bacterium]|nr:class I SAM-dependent methyltransferase [bacterium]